MATKTITIDLEAYNKLKAAKQDKESFSQTIKRVIPSPIDFRKFRNMLSSAHLGKEATEAVEAQVKNRQKPSKRTR